MAVFQYSPKVGVLALCLFVSFISLPESWGQQPESNGTRVAVATFTSERISVDGRLDESAWQNTRVVGEFVQQEPSEGQPASERSEVRILYDRDNLYIGATLLDSAPPRIVINNIARDFPITDQDVFGIVLDTYQDKSNGYEMRTTPVGGQSDLQFSNGGQDLNLSWDGVWFVETQATPDGTTIEMAIPFKTLRFSREPVQLWGVQFYRQVRRSNELSVWSPIPRRYSVTRAVSFVGELQGVANVEPGRNLQVRPYLLAGVERLDSRGEDASGDFDAGVDVKYGVTPGLTLDLTVNTDFSHVEADVQPVNLTRFPLFFQEKRMFFLENAGIFQFGSLVNSEALLFHSRTIGLEGGEPIPILGGARLSGRAGRTQLGLLNMQTRSEDAVPATNFTVTRVRQGILENSEVGVMFTNRQSRLADDHNRAVGADGRFRFLQTDLQLDAAVARTLTPGLTGDDAISKIGGAYANNLLSVTGSYTDIGGNFNPEMGFVRHHDRGILKNEVEIRPRFDPGTAFGSVVRNILLSASSERIWFSDGGMEYKRFQPILRFDFQDGSWAQTIYTGFYENLLEGFNLPFDSAVPPGAYRWHNYLVEFFSNPSKPLSGAYEFVRGSLYNAQRMKHEFSLQVRPNYRFMANLFFERNRLTFPDKRVYTNEARLRLGYNFSPKMFLDALLQYNNDDDVLSSNIRFRLIHRPLSDIYVVYNDVRQRRDGTADWGLSLKYTHLLNF